LAVFNVWECPQLILLELRTQKFPRFECKKVLECPTLDPDCTLYCTLYRTLYCSDLTDAEFCQYLEAEERRINHCQVVLDLLRQAQSAHLQQQQQGASGAGAAGRSSSRGAADRVSARIAYLIAEQQMETHNLTAARKLLLQVAYTYRR
jgi:hypothetical protein